MKITLPGSFEAVPHGEGYAVIGPGVATMIATYPDSYTPLHKLLYLLVKDHARGDEIKEVARAALEYIDALPSDVAAALPAMPGFDRDWAENVLAWSDQEADKTLYTCPEYGALRCAEQQSTADTVNQICDMFRIGSEARTPSTILENIRNVIRFSEQQAAIEREFFMVPGEPDEDYPDEDPEDECLVNRWGSTTEQYVEQFGKALTVITQPVAIADELYKLANHIASAKSGLPPEWQSWADEIEDDLRRMVVMNRTSPPAAP